MRSVRCQNLLPTIATAFVLVTTPFFAPAQDLVPPGLNPPGLNPAGLNPPGLNPQNINADFEQIVGQPRGLPQLPPEGAWGQVINVTSRWIVVQNHAGQQFPVRISDIGNFFVRWRSSLDALTANSIVEASGIDLGSNTVQTGHVDVFEGTSRALVTPTYTTVAPQGSTVAPYSPGFNRFLTAWDFTGQYSLFGWAYSPAPIAVAFGTNLHVVGSVTERNPLRLAAPGNIIATVTPEPPDNLTVTEVTRGSISYMKKGDYVFLVPTDINPRGLIVSQFILYKAITLAEFQAGREPR